MRDGKDLLAEMRALRLGPLTDLRTAIRTQSFRQTIGQPMTLRRAQAFAAILDTFTPFVYEGDYLVGSLRSSFAVMDEETQLTEPQNRDMISERNFSTHFDHVIVDYPRLMRLGFTGIRQEITHRLHADSALGDQERNELTAMAISIEAAIGYLGRYAQACERKAGMTPGTEGKRWQEVATACSNLTSHPPGSFHEAVQLTWFVHHLLCLEGRYANGLGRLDQYLAPFYTQDVAQGLLTTDQALLILTHLWAKIGEHGVLFGGDDVVNITIGGTTPTGTDGTNAFSYLCLTATRALQIPGPNLSARIHANTTELFYRACVDTIATGVGYPALFSDEVLIPALQAIGIPTEEARDYALVGCIETYLPGKQPPWSDSRFNLPKCLELTLGNGRDLRTGELLGLETGLPQEFASFEQVLAALELQIRYATHHHAEQFRILNRDISPQEYTSPFLSSLMTDCILRGRDLNDGGTRFPSNHGIAAMGLGTVVDSLAAIQHSVFKESRFSMETICQALQANFAGYEELQKWLWYRAPKYGNDSTLR